MAFHVLATELIKLRRSLVTVLTLVAFLLVPAVGGLFMWIVSEPDRARQLGLLGTKATLTGLDASWPSYFSLMTQTVGIAGMVVLAIITAYVFGREYAEGTAKNLLALPVPRWMFALAKLVVIALWWTVLIAVALVGMFVIGNALGLPGLTAEVARRGLVDILLAAAISLLLVPPVAFISTLGRGYLPPFGFAILTLLVGNVLGATGWGKWFPWSIVPMFTMQSGGEVEPLTVGSFVVVGGTFALGLAATIAQLRWADNTQ